MDHILAFLFLAQESLGGPAAASGGAAAGGAAAGGAPAGAPPQAGGGMESLIFLGLMLVVFYFFLIRPQQKKAKKHREFVESLKPGDQVITSSGIFGKITAIKGNRVTLEVAKNTRIQVHRNFVGHTATADAEKELSETPQS